MGQKEADMRFLCGAKITINFEADSGFAGAHPAGESYTCWSGVVTPLVPVRHVVPRILDPPSILVNMIDLRHNKSWRILPADTLRGGLDLGGDAVSCRLLI